MDKNEPKQSGLSWSTPQNQTPKPAQPVKPIVLTTKTPPKEPQQNTNAAKYAGMVVVGIIAGVVLAWGWSSWHPAGMPADTSMATTTSTTTSGDNLGVDNTNMPTLSADSSLAIMSPQPAGTSVTVTKAVVDEPTWVVVYEDNNGKPGNALGAALFFPGTETGTVALLRATMPGKMYLAARQVDNGDHKFSLKDDPLLSVNGQVQWVTFETN